MKLVPFNVNVNAAPPALVEVGAMDVSVGTGFAAAVCADEAWPTATGGCAAAGAAFLVASVALAVSLAPGATEASGGFAPFFATWLIARTGDPLSPSYYLMATALLSIIALMAIERRATRAYSR